MRVNDPFQHHSTPLAYLITFTCYGTRLHGSEQGSVDREHRAVGADPIPADAFRAGRDQKQMPEPPYVLDDERRGLVLKAIQQVCTYRHWKLFAAHVRTSHVHAVVQAEAMPERVMNDFKSYASRALNAGNLDAPNRARWTRHGSTRYLWKPEQVENAIRYVIAEQGEPMELFDIRNQ